MPLIRKILFSLVFIVGFYSNAYAHDSNIATIEVRHVDSTQWLVRVMSPLYELDKAMRRYNKEHSHNLDSLVVGSKEYKELIIDYVKSEFSMVAVSTEKGATRLIETTLGAGRIKLEDHLTTMIFEIKGMPETFSQINFKLAFMSDNHGQHNVLRLFDGAKTKRHMLVADNDFSVVEADFYKSGTMSESQN